MCESLDSRACKASKHAANFSIRCTAASIAAELVQAVVGMVELLLQIVVDMAVHMMMGFARM